MKLLPSPKTELDLFATYFLLMYVCVPLLIQFALATGNLVVAIANDPLKAAFSPLALTLSTLVAGIYVSNKARRLGFVFSLRAEPGYWIAACMIPIATQAFHLLLHSGTNPPHHGAYIENYSSIHGIAFFMLSTVIAPVFEEFVMRGLLFAWFKRNHSEFRSAIYVTVIFMLLHFNLLLSPKESLILLIGSTSFIALRIRSKSLGPAMLAHALFNAGVLLIP